MSATTLQIEAVLKRFYIGKIVEQINQESLLLDNFEEETVTWSGSTAIVPLHTARNAAVGAAAEGSTLPIPGQQTYEKIMIESAYVYGQFSFTGPARAAAAKSAGAFANMVDLQMKPLIQDVRHYSDVCMFTGGPVIGYVWQKNAAIGAGPVGMEASVRTQYSPSNPSGNPVGQLVQIYRTDTFVTVDTPRTLLSINPTGTNIILSANVDTTVDTLGNTIPSSVTLVLVSAAPGLAIEPIGLAGNLGAPTWFNLQRGLPSTSTLAGNFLLANPTSAAYDDLTTNSLQNLSSQIMYKSGKMPDAIWLSPLMISAYSSLLQGVASGVAGAARLDVKTKPEKGDIGFTGFEWSGIRFFQGQDCPLGVIYMLQRNHWKLALLKAGEFDESTGSILRAVPQQDTYAGMYSWYYQSYTDRPNANGALCGVAIPT
jgi:hypothetical protein